MMSHKDNLTIVAQRVGNFPDGYPHFDMESYYHEPAFNPPSERDEMAAAVRLNNPVMGACGCLLGHAVAAGISTEGATSWLDFAQRSFGVDGPAYEYLFGGEWFCEDNTPKGAAERIQTYLRSGVPRDFDGFGRFHPAGQ